MSVAENALHRLSALVQEGADIANPNHNNQITDERQIARCRGWLVGAQAIVETICEHTGPYVREVTRITETPVGYMIHSHVWQVTAILNRLKADAQDGLLTSIADTVAAKTFDNFLDHAAAYLHSEKKNEAGVIAGVVFEDSVRRICKKYEIAEKDRSLEDLINDLARRNIITGVKAKRAKSAAHVRTKATHAQWHEYELGDVNAAIVLTRELLQAHLET